VSPDQNDHPLIQKANGNPAFLWIAFAQVRFCEMALLKNVIGSREIQTAFLNRSFTFCRIVGDLHSWLIVVTKIKKSMIYFTNGGQTQKYQRGNIFFG
jgi:hypothetical protein